jgi:hypothetical protein
MNVAFSGEPHKSMCFVIACFYLLPLIFFTSHWF